MKNAHITALGITRKWAISERESWKNHRVFGSKGVFYLDLHNRTNKYIEVCSHWTYWCNEWSRIFTLSNQGWTNPEKLTSNRDLLQWLLLDIREIYVLIAMCVVFCHLFVFVFWCACEGVWMGTLILLILFLQIVVRSVKPPPRPISPSALKV